MKKKHNGSIKARTPAKIQGNWRMRKRQSLKATGHISEGKRFHHSANPSLFSFNGSFPHFTVECGFPPKIKTTIFGAVFVQ